jgi:DNA-binding NarL/FixJ family response regulator
MNNFVSGLNCLLVEDQTLVAELLRGLLQVSQQVACVRIAPSVQEACRLIDQLPPDLLILDLGLPDGDGQQVGLHLLKRHPKPKIILLSAQLHDFDCDPLLLPHIHASVDKTSAYKELTFALNGLNTSIERFSDGRSIGEPLPGLSLREQEVFLLIGSGKSSRMIASYLNISLLTVESHRKAISQKLGSSGAELVRLAALHLYKTQNSLEEIAIP